MDNNNMDSTNIRKNRVDLGDTFITWTPEDSFSPKKTNSRMDAAGTGSSTTWEPDNTGSKAGSEE